MKLLPEKLNTVLEKNAAGFYFCSSDEIFLVNELSDNIVTVAKKQGFNEITSLHIDSEFFLEKFYEKLYTPSLFSPKTVLVIQLTHWKLEEKIKTLLTESSRRKTDHTLVIIKGPKIERATSNTKWFQAMP